MNSRRSFLKSLTLLAAGAAGCPTVFVPKFEPVRWKVQNPQWVPNPAYQDATYDVIFANYYGTWRFFSDYYKHMPTTFPENMGETIRLL